MRRGDLPKVWPNAKVEATQTLFITLDTVVVEPNKRMGDYKLALDLEPEQQPDSMGHRSSTDQYHTPRVNLTGVSRTSFGQLLWRAKRLPEYSKIWLPAEVAPQAHKAANWWELFFDLACVASAGQVAHTWIDLMKTVGTDEEGLTSGSGHCDIDRGDLFGLGNVDTTVLHLAFGLTALMLVWFQETLWNTRFDGGDDFLHRFLKIFTFIGACGIGTNLIYCYPISETLRHICNMYAIARGALVVRSVIANWFVKETRRNKTLNAVAALSLVETTLMGFQNLITNTDAKFIYISIVLIVPNFVIRILLLSHLPKEMRPNPHHFPERFGLLIILTLGESIIQIIHNLPHLGPEIFCAGFIVLATWWIYFDNIVTDVVKYTRWFTVWMVLHLPLVGCLCGLAASFSLMLGSWATLTTKQKEYTIWSFSVCLAVVSLCISFIRAINFRVKETEQGVFSQNREYVRLFLALVAAALYIILPFTDWSPKAMLFFASGVNLLRIIRDLITNFVNQARMMEKKAQQSQRSLSEPFVNICSDNADVYRGEEP